MTEELIAKVMGNDLSISTKHSIEIASFIRYKNLQKAKQQLQLVTSKELAIPLKVFHKDRGHRKGKMGPGFYPEKAAKQFILLLNSLEANARNKGMDPNLIFLAEVIANRAAIRRHMGRNRGRMKSTNIKMLAKEKKVVQKPKQEIKEKPKEKKIENKPVKKEEPKKETKKPEKKQEKK